MFVVYIMCRTVVVVWQLAGVPFVEVCCLCFFFQAEDGIRDPEMLVGSEMCIRDSDCIASCHRIHANPSSFLCLYHLSMPQFAWIRWHDAMQSMKCGHNKAAKPSPHTAGAVSYTHLQAHKTSQEPVFRILP